MRGAPRRGLAGFVGAGETGRVGFGSFHARRGADGALEEQLLALAAEEKKFQDFSHHTLAHFAGRSVLGGANRPRHSEHLERALELLKYAALAIDHLIRIRTVEPEVGIFFIHEEIQFVAEGIILVEGGKSVHVQCCKAEPVPAAMEIRPL